MDYYKEIYSCNYNLASCYAIYLGKTKYYLKRNSYKLYYIWICRVFVMCINLYIIQKLQTKTAQFTHLFHPPQILFLTPALKTLQIRGSHLYFSSECVRKLRMRHSCCIGNCLNGQQTFTGNNILGQHKQQRHISYREKCCKYQTRSHQSTYRRNDNVCELI